MTKIPLFPPPPPDPGPIPEPPRIPAISDGERADPRTVHSVGHELQVLLNTLVAALNRDRSYDEALKAQQVLTIFGEWLRDLDDVWRESTIDELNAVEEHEL